MTELSSPRVWSCHDLPYWLMHTGHKPGPWSWSQAEVEELKWCYMVTVWHNGLVFCHRCKASGSGSQWAVFLWCWSHIWATLSLNPGQPHDPDVLLKPSVSQYWKYSKWGGSKLPHSRQGACQHHRLHSAVMSVYSSFAVFPIFSFRIQSSSATGSVDQHAPFLPELWAPHICFEFETSSRGRSITMTELVGHLHSGRGVGLEMGSGSHTGCSSFFGTWDFLELSVLLGH